jgi:hypothetical protein
MTSILKTKSFRHSEPNNNSGLKNLFVEILRLKPHYDKHVMYQPDRHSEGVKRPKNLVDSGMLSLSLERESRCRSGNDLHLQGEGNPRVSNPLPNFKLSSHRLTSRNSALPQGRGNKERRLVCQ